MSKTAQLLALAEAALSVEPIDVDDGDVTFNGGSTSWNKTQRNFFRAFTPETIRQLVELVLLMKFHFDTIADEESWDTDGTWNSSSYPDEIANEAIEAFNNFERNH